MLRNSKNVLFEVVIGLPEAYQVPKEIYKNILIQLGVSPEAIIELYQDGQNFLSCYCSSYKRALDLRNKLGRYKLRGIVIRIKRVIKENWQNVWKESFKPFYLTEDVMIVPAWRKTFKLKKGTQAIFLDTSVAFGTGLHETTQLMARLIESKEGHFQSFLDIGTGTGILALVACQYGAKEIYAIDICPQSVTIANDNFKRNGWRNLKAKKRDIQGGLEGKPFDFVAANLNSFDLIKWRKKILSNVKPRGLLAVSGISGENLKKFKTSFKELSLQCLKELRGKNWCALLYQKEG